MYDSQNQLLRENNQAGQFTHTWEYNNAGNIQCRKEYVYTTGELGTPTDTVEYTYGDSGWGDLLTAYDGTAITYDEIGNPDAIGGWSFTWEHGRELASMSNGTATWTNTYNADGIRTQRTDGTTTYRYIYTGSSLTQLQVGTDTLFFNYDGSGTPLTVTYNGVTYYYVTNLQGDIVAILDSTGTAVVSYTYDAWGKPLSTTGTMAATLGATNPLRYRGYVYDTETSLYYLQSRYYNPQIGRFLNADAYTSTGQGFSGNNTFVYCGNNPIAFSDYGGNRYCAATTVAGESKEDRAASCAVQREVSRERSKKPKPAAAKSTEDQSLTGVFTTGNFISATLFVFNISGCIELAFDLKGNAQLILTYGIEITTSGAFSVAGGASGSAFIMPDTSYLAGDTTYAGGGTYCAIPNTPIAVGGGGNIGQTSDGYWGILGSTGVAPASGASPESHIGSAKTILITDQFNVKNWIAQWTP